MDFIIVAIVIFFFGAIILAFLDFILSIIGWLFIMGLIICGVIVVSCGNMLGLILVLIGAACIT